MVHDSYHEHPDHMETNKNCKCKHCSTARSNRCSHPHRCFQEANSILSELSPKFNPFDNDTLYNNEISTNNYQAATNYAISTPNNIKIFNPSVTSSSEIHEHIRIFINTKKYSPTPARRVPSATNPPEDIVVFTDSSCSLNGDTRASAGSGVWFSHNDPRNSATPVSRNITQTNNSGELLVSWYNLPSFLSHLFPPLSVPHPISITFQLHLTLSTCLPPPLLQLQGVLMQLCYICTWTSLRLTSDLLRPDSHTKGYHLYTSYNLSDPFFIINNR